MKNADLGINPEGVISISIADFKYDKGKSYTAIKNELKSIPEIKSV